MSVAPTFPRAGVSLLSELARNNTTAWFHAHKDEYRSLVQEPALQLVAYVNAQLAKFAPAYVLEKKNPLSRPNRDTRFSKDKSPYRTDVSAVFPRRGLEKHEAAGFFLRVGPDGGELVAGSFMPGPEQLRAIRDHIVANEKSFLTAVRAKPLVSLFGEMQGTQLQRVPRGYDATPTLEGWLRRQQFFFTRSLSKSVLTSAELGPEIVKSFRAATPFVEMLDGAFGNT